MFLETLDMFLDMFLETLDMILDSSEMKGSWPEEL